MSDLRVRHVETEDDLARLDRALRALSAELNDDHRAQLGDLKVALEGPIPVAQAMLALQADETLGATLFSPLFSTVTGTAGVYVSDLWVAAAARGHGLGRRLLAETALRAARLWQAEWITLAVYAESARSRRFYEGLGFAPQAGMVTMRLDGDATQRLMRDAE